MFTSTCYAMFTNTCVLFPYYASYIKSIVFCRALSFSWDLCLCRLPSVEVAERRMRSDDLIRACGEIRCSFPDVWLYFEEFYTNKVVISHKWKLYGIIDYVLVWLTRIFRQAFIWKQVSNRGQKKSRNRYTMSPLKSHTKRKLVTQKNLAMQSVRELN